MKIQSVQRGIALLFFVLMSFGWMAEGFPEPIPDIRANDADGPAVLTQTESLRIAVGLDSGGAGDDADWWLAADTPFGIYFLTPDGWLPNLLPLHRGPLFSFPFFDLLAAPISVFPVGTYFFYFGVDTPMDGQLSFEGLRADRVEVSVAHEDTGSLDALPAILGPVFMYYLDRYYSGIPDESEIGRQVASILSKAPEAQVVFRRLLNNYKALPDESKKEMFDAHMVDMTKTINEEINIAAVRSYLRDTVPLWGSAYEPSGPPVPPDALVAENNSSADPEFPSYRIRLTWQDNASNEAGFVIFRGFKSGDALVPGSLVPFAKVGPNVTQFTDTLTAPQNVEDSYCYQVAAYSVSPIALLGQPPEQMASARSNSSCATYHPESTPPGPDTDFDGIPDKDDYCPGVPGNVFGCPDSDKDGVADMSGDKDQDGVADLNVDQCIALGPEGQDETLFMASNDGGPRPDPGCPIKYRLSWMKMQVLNNSDYFYNEGNDPFNTPPQVDAGEEPYLIFSLVNGQDPGGKARSWTKRWCCGERIDVKAGKNPFEPDTDLNGEESSASQYLGSLADGSFHGIPVLGELGDFAYIDTKTELSMAVTLMERDWTNTKCFDTEQVTEFDLAVKLGGAAGGAIAACVGSFGFGCGAAIAGAVVSIIKTLFSFDPDPICADVADSDDFMGVDGWFISRQQALLKTSGNGAYGFWFDMPTTVKKAILPGIIPPVSVLATMRARLYFCLYREGIPENEVNSRCSNYTQAPWSMMTWTVGNP